MLFISKLKLLHVLLKSIAQIRNTDKELFCDDKEENLTVKWIAIHELLNTKDDIFYDRRKLLL